MAAPARTVQHGRNGAPLPPGAVVTGLGAVTSVGDGVAASVAAFRAGIARPSALELQVLSRDTPGTEPVVGHCVPGLDGFTGVARLAKLGALALADLLGAAGGTDPATGERIPVILCTSASPRPEWDFWQEWLEESLPPALAAAAALPVARERLVLRALGHASGLLALREAAAQVLAGEAERVIVLAVDSLVEGDALEALASDGRLKTGDDPTGLMPGEAGVAALVETEAGARRGGRRPLARIHAVEITETGRSPLERGPASGRALARTVLAAWPEGRPMHLVVGDHNGETHRAAEWGCAQIELQRRRALGDATVLFPAASFGDTGAASGLLALACAVRLAARGATKGPDAVLWSSGDAGLIAAARVSSA